MNHLLIQFYAKGGIQSLIAHTAEFAGAIVVVRTVDPQTGQDLSRNIETAAIHRISTNYKDL